MPVPTVKLEVHLCEQRRSIYVTFCNEQAAVRYIKARTSYCAVFQTEDSPIPANWNELLDTLYPTCHHGMDALMCLDPFGPHHFGTREWEISMGF